MRTELIVLRAENALLRASVEQLKERLKQYESLRVPIAKGAGAGKK